MTMNPKTKKTELKDMPISEKNMTKEEMEKLTGGAAGQGIPGVNLGLKKGTGYCSCGLAAGHSGEHLKTSAK